jgi:predicted alpha/beta-fold hydrolase
MSTNGEFRPLRGFGHRHLQTVWPASLRRRPSLDLTRQRIELPDDDFLDLFWGPRRAGPVVLLLHGLGGCSRSAYVLGLAKRLAERGFQAVAMHYRGAGGVPNRQPRFYHAGAWEDPAEALAQIRTALPGRPVAAVGFSLGGSILLNWLARGDAPRLPDAAVSVSVPFDLAACARAVNRGFARLYQRHLLGCLSRMYRSKFASRTEAPVPVPELRRIRTLYAFDERITAPLHGFQGADDYYARCSSGPLLRHITVPLLIVQARDDPFVPAATLPDPTRLGARTRLLLTRHGGHVGWLGGTPCRPEYWIERCIPDYLAARLSDA